MELCLQHVERILGRFDAQSLGFALSDSDEDLRSIELGGSFLANDDNVWYIGHHERGAVTREQEFRSESAACSAFLGLFCTSVRVSLRR